MLQTKRVTSLEEGIIRTCCLEVSHLRIVGDGLRELAGIEIAVAYSVERIGVGRFGSQGSIQIDGEGLSCLVVFVLREIGVTLQIPGDGVVLRALSVIPREEGIQILGALLVATQAIVRFRANVVGLGGVLIRLRTVRQHLAHPFYRLLHLTLHEVIGA